MKREKTPTQADDQLYCVDCETLDIRCDYYRCPNCGSERLQEMYSDGGYGDGLAYHAAS